MKKRVWIVVYLLIVAAGVVGIVFMQKSLTKNCVTKDKICVSYTKAWSKVSPTSPYDMELTRTKPFPGLIRVAEKDVNITGSANALAGALDQQLSKEAPGYHLVETNALLLGKQKVIAVELVFDYLPANSPVTVRQSYVVAPHNGKTYYFISEVTANNYSQFKTELDQVLGRVKLL